MIDPIVISAGESRTCSVTASREVFCWGRAPLGDGSTSDSNAPRRVMDLSNAVGIDAGLGHVCALSDGNVRCWGGNARGQLGDGTTDDRIAPVVVTPP